MYVRVSGAILRIAIAITQISGLRGWCRPDDRTMTRPPPFARSPVQPGSPFSPVTRSGQKKKPDRPTEATV